MSEKKRREKERKKKKNNTSQLVSLLVHKRIIEKAAAFELETGTRQPNRRLRKQIKSYQH